MVASQGGKEQSRLSTRSTAASVYPTFFPPDLVRVALNPKPRRSRYCLFIRHRGIEVGSPQTGGRITGRDVEHRMSVLSWMTQTSQNSYLGPPRPAHAHHPSTAGHSERGRDDFKGHLSGPHLDADSEVWKDNEVYSHRPPYPPALNERHRSVVSPTLHDEANKVKTYSDSSRNSGEAELMSAAQSHCDTKRRMANVRSQVPPFKSCQDGQGASGQAGGHNVDSRTFGPKAAWEPAKHANAQDFRQSHTHTTPIRGKPDALATPSQIDACSLHSDDSNDTITHADLSNVTETLPFTSSIPPILPALSSTSPLRRSLAPALENLRSTSQQDQGTLSYHGL